MLSSKDPAPLNQDEFRPNLTPFYNGLLLVETHYQHGKGLPWLSKETHPEINLHSHTPTN